MGSPSCGTDCDDSRTGEFRDTADNCGVCGQACFLTCGADLTCDEIRSLSAGDNHTCGVLRGGRIACWGANDRGQLGDGTTTASGTPVIVPTVADATRVAAGARFTCALRASGRVSCWGNNTDGETGSGSTNATVSAPSDVLFDVGRPLLDVVDVAAGDSHACAALSTGTVYCWGRNSNAQVTGPPATERFIYAQPVATLTGAVSLALGRAHGCALRADGNVSCWGGNGLGQLGDGRTSHGSLCGGADCAAPVSVPGTFRVIAAGGDRTCGTDAAQMLRCWGEGVGTTPSTVAGVTDVRSVAVGPSHSCVVHDSNQRVACWGRNGVGQLATGDQGDRAAPTNTELADIDSVTVGSGVGHSCALGSNGRVMCWGSNRDSQLGDASSSHPGCDGASFWGDCSPTPTPLARSETP
ncbi:MAG: hypothetical protein K8H88_01890 [Sandaracinaceae bacterium]|nr:hypothetical protein [Sandaracinaceae bacterium]